MPRTRVRDAWKKTSDDGSAREGASTQQAEEAGDAAASAPNADDPASSDDVKEEGDGVSGPPADPPRAARGSRTGKKSAAKRVSQRRDTAGDGS